MRIPRSFQSGDHRDQLIEVHRLGEIIGHTNNQSGRPDLGHGFGDGVVIGQTVLLGEPNKGQLVHRIIFHNQDFMPAGVSLRNVTERYSIVIPLVYDTLVTIGAVKAAAQFFSMAKLRTLVGQFIG